MKIKSYLTVLSILLVIGVFVKDIVGAMTFGLIGLFLMNRSKEFDLFELIVMVFEFMLISIASRYDIISQLTSNSTLVITALMIIVVVKCKFSFSSFMEYYRDFSLKLIIITLLSSLVGVLNSGIGTVMLLSTIVMAFSYINVEKDEYNTLSSQS